MFHCANDPSCRFLPWVLGCWCSAKRNAWIEFVQWSCKIATCSWFHETKSSLRFLDPGSWQSMQSFFVSCIWVVFPLPSHSICTSMNLSPRSLSQGSSSLGGEWREIGLSCLHFRLSPWLDRITQREICYMVSCPEVVYATIQQRGVVISNDLNS